MLTLARPPQTDEELWWVIRALWGITLPRVAVCDGHTSPFQAVADAYFARAPNFAVWYASRGSGKSLALAALGLTKSLVDEVDVTILGGSMTQSMNVRQHMADMMETEHAPVTVVAKDIQTLIKTKHGAKIQPLPASQTTVRGPHPPLQLLDEVDEMDEGIYNASLGQAMEQESKTTRVRMDEYIVASSTWQNPEGTFSGVIDKAREEGTPIYTWCWRELLEENGGWQSRRAIEAKRKTVSAQMWLTEYELNEPSGSFRAFDLDKVEQYFTDYKDPLEESHKPDDDVWVWEEPEPSGIYAVGADWGKEKDKTVITVVRYDVKPYRVVKARVVNRRPWPVMIEWFNQDVHHYQANGQHDKTGLGSVVNDYIDEPDLAGGFVFVGRKRSQMLLDYITCFENGDYLLPKALKSFYRAHRSATVADVFAPAKWNDHLPDEISSMGLVNRAIQKMPAPVPELLMVPKIGDAIRKVDQQFHAKPEAGSDWREDRIRTVVGAEPADGYSLIS
jgi:hypothetical protein